MKTYQTKQLNRGNTSIYDALTMTVNTIQAIIILTISVIFAISIQLN